MRRFFDREKEIKPILFFALVNCFTGFWKMLKKKQRIKQRNNFDVFFPYTIFGET